MAVRIGLHSRLRFGQFVSVDGYEFWDVLDLPDIPAQAADVVHEVVSGDRIDLIAEKWYGDPVLWWVIAAANNMELLPTQLQEGTLLRIPAPGFILHDFFNRSSVR